MLVMMRRLPLPSASLYSVRTLAAALSLYCWAAPEPEDLNYLIVHAVKRRLREQGSNVDLSCGSFVTCVGDSDVGQTYEVHTGPDVGNLYQSPTKALG